MMHDCEAITELELFVNDTWIGWIRVGPVLWLNGSMYFETPIKCVPCYPGGPPVCKSPAGHFLVMLRMRYLGKSIVYPVAHATEMEIVDSPHVRRRAPAPVPIYDGQPVDLFRMH